jgi:hypothetical protein
MKLLKSNCEDEMEEGESVYSLCPLAVMWPARVSGGPLF